MRRVAQRIAEVVLVACALVLLLALSPSLLLALSPSLLLCELVSDADDPAESYRRYW